MKTHSYFHKATEGENITAHFALEEIQISPPLASDGDPTTCICTVKLGYLTQYYIICHGYAK